MSTGVAGAPPLVTRRTRVEPTSTRLANMTSRGFLHIMLIAIAVVWLMPSLGLFITSFRPRSDIQSSGWWTVFLAPHLTLANYSEVLSGQGLYRNFLNSFIITVPSVILPILIAALAAYGFSWTDFPARDWIFLGIIGLMIIPIQMTLVPVLILFRTLHLTSSFVGIWLAHTAFALPFATFLLRNFFVTLPHELMEAAKLDGASEIGIFSRIVLPLSVPAIASLGIFQFLWVWNDLLMALVFVQEPSRLPLTVRISQLLSTYSTEWHLMSAGSFVLMFVPLVVFFSLQRYFVRGLLAGSVKS